MFLSDPTLRRIAADTGEVLPEHLWRYDTATEDALGDLSRLLHKTALAYNATTALLDKAAQRLTSRPDLRTAGYTEVLANALVAIQRHSVLADVLLDAYHAWRKHRPICGNDEQYLLLRPGDPAHGVAVLRQHGDYTWLVFPDTEAATAFEVPYPCRVIGQVTQTDEGWKPIAYTNPAHLETQPGMTYPLPVCDDIGSACRSLLRWWQLRHSTTWRNRTPNQLSEDELAQLTA